MKAKDLIKILEQDLEAEVCIREYIGGTEPILNVDSINIKKYNISDKIQFMTNEYDAIDSDCIDKNITATENFFLLN